MQLRAPLVHTPLPHRSTRSGEHPSFISLSDLSMPPSSPRPVKTPGMTIALATPALRKAVLPDLLMSPELLATSPRNALWDLGAPPSPSVAGTPRVFDATAPGTPTGTKTPTGPRGGGDYFSLLPTATEPPKAGEALPTAGGTLMGRLRMLGKNSKRPTTGEVFDQGPVLESAAVEVTNGGESKVVRFPGVSGPACGC